MQYVQIPYTEWIAPFGYEQYLSNGTNRHPHLSSDASSHTDGSSAYGSSTSYLYDVLPSSTGRMSPELQSNYEVLIKYFLFNFYLKYFINKTNFL
jgi:hypothetical protein